MCPLGRGSFVRGPVGDTSCKISKLYKKTRQEDFESLFIFLYVLAPGTQIKQSK